MVTSSVTKVVGTIPEEIPVIVVSVVVPSSTVLVVVSCSSVVVAVVVAVVGAAIQCKGNSHINMYSALIALWFS